MKFLALMLAMTVLYATIASAYALNVGGDFGRSWLDQHGDKSVVSQGKAGLWDWGGAPKGYQLIGGKLYPAGSDTTPQWYYPYFMTNATPIVINKSTLLTDKNYIPLDFLSPDFVNDPWVLAQISGRPVLVGA